ncbi:sensor histidine kinase [Phenylobacterium sp.]|jgi:two-component sensor histidine kinase|uniref:sensor histidine kinase n=1 Tax=Phenylobacterium sp. TaxID=1871053 RepID=UPI002F414C33
MTHGDLEADNGPGRQVAHERGIRLLLATLAALLLTFGVLGGVFLWYDNATRWVLHTHDVRRGIGDVLQALTDAETAQRGYLLTGDAVFLRQIETARGLAAGDVVAVEALTRDNPEQQDRIRSLRSAIDTRMRIIDRTLALRRSGDLPGAVAVIRTGRGIAAMSQIRAQLAALDAAEARLEARRAGGAATVRVLGGASLVVFCLLLAALVLKVTRDIGADRDAEAARAGRLRALLEERTLLIDEVNHRVKNSLQQIASVVRLQARALPAGDAREALNKTLARIMAVGRVHQQLYKPEGRFGLFDAGEYSETLARELVDSLGRDDITLATDVEPAHLDIRQAGPLALILNELVTNALKYGCPEGRPSRINVGFRTVGDQFRLTVSDEGDGLPNGFKPGASASLGMRVIEALARQLGGRLSVAPSDVGAAFAVEFPRSAT